MNLPAQFRSLDGVTLPPRPLHLAIGMFDGVHLGHQAVIEPAVHSARRCAGLAGVLTFWPHPSALFRPAERTRMIMDPEMKAQVLRRLGVDVIVEQPFVLEFARIPAPEFLPYLRQRLSHLAAVYVGENWRFGAGRKGDVRQLLADAAKHGVPVMSIPQMLCNGRPISSTRIRDCLEAGAIEEANLLLGYSYFAEGIVVAGQRLGREIGFPTLNLPWQPELEPRPGVYAVRVSGGNDAPRPAVAYYGRRPTVAPTAAPLLETHVLGDCPWNEGDHVTVEWLRFLRPDQKFPGVEALRAQIALDRDAAVEFFRQQAAS